jgi:nucleoside-diphosphate-sugar epimerase
VKVFVTGAGGFVGANLARRLLTEGHEVHVLLRSESDTWRLGEALGQMNVHRGDIRDFEAVRRALEATKPEGIVHMATNGAYPTVQNDFLQIFETNMTGTANLIRASEKIRYECFINTSSSSEYGLVTKPMAEDDLPKPVNYYGATKAGATVLCQTHTRITGAPIINTRLFSVYGPYEEKIRLVPSTIAKCLLKKPLVFTRGTQKRDFIYISDVEEAYLELLRSPHLKGEVLNIGTGTQYSVREMVQEIVKCTGSNEKQEWGVIPTWRFEADSWVADMSKAHAKLRWRAKVGLAEGVEQTVAWMRENIAYYGRE